MNAFALNSCFQIHPTPISKVIPRPRYLFIIVVWGLLITAGCEDPAQIGAGGLVIEALPAQPEPVRREAGPQPWRLENGDESRRDRDRPARQGWGQDRQFPSASGNWGDARELPGNDLPSDSAATSSDRKMPSASLPSRTEKWGRDRECPVTGRTGVKIGQCRAIQPFSRVAKKSQLPLRMTIPNSRQRLPPVRPAAISAGREKRRWCECGRPHTRGGVRKWYSPARSLPTLSLTGLTSRSD